MITLNKYFQSKFGIRWTEPRCSYKLRSDLEHIDLISLNKFRIKHIVLVFIFSLFIFIGTHDKIDFSNQFLSSFLLFLISIVISTIIVFLLDILSNSHINIVLIENYLFINKSGANLEVNNLNNFDNYEIISGNYKNFKYTAIRFNGTKSKVIFLDKSLSINKIKDFFSECSLKEINIT